MRRFRYLYFCLVVCALGYSQPINAPDSGLASTPPMGWNGWNHFECKVSDQIIRAQADAMVSSGMKAAGYEYINIDDCWQGHRDATGSLHPNSRFPDMKALAEYVHSKGLKLGIYSSPGPKTCDGYEGSYGHEEQDAQTYAGWGIDLLKYDLCSLEGKGDQIAAYQKMGSALKKTGRPIVYSLCQYGMEGVWKWGRSVGGNLWRTTDDIRDNYYSMVVFGFGQNGLEAFAGPGGWNDPDMLEIGNGGLNEDESKTQMSLWSILAAPLFAGNDLSKMNSSTLAILTNAEVIRVDQDANGIQGRRVRQVGPLEIWMKPLSDGSKAVGLFNLDWGSMPMTVNFAELGLGASVTIRDLWEHKELGVFHESFTATVPKHGVVMIKVK
ncbi:MAG: glycoside hydrolase family 27 protein [Bryobacteraceae bacterium]